MARKAGLLDLKDSDDVKAALARMISEEMVDAVRSLRLSWGEHGRGGEVHVEWHAPCGCAYHPEPTPHVHPCESHGKPVLSQGP